MKQMKEISKELLSPSLLESLNLQKSMEIGAGRNKEDCAPSQYQLVAGGCCLLGLEDTASSQYQLVAGAGYHLYRPLFIAHDIASKPTTLAALLSDIEFHDFEGADYTQTTPLLNKWGAVK